MQITSEQSDAQAFCPQERSYSRRRYVYVYGITLFILASCAILVFRGYTGPLVELFVRESLSLLGSVVLLYLGAGVLDRSRVLEKIGDSFSRNGNTRREETTVTRTVATTPPVVPPPVPPGVPPPAPVTHIHFDVDNPPPPIRRRVG